MIHIAPGAVWGSRHTPLFLPGCTDVTKERAVASIRSFRHVEPGIEKAAAHSDRGPRSIPEVCHRRDGIGPVAGGVSPSACDIQRLAGPDSMVVAIK